MHEKVGEGAANRYNKASSEVARQPACEHRSEKVQLVSASRGLAIRRCKCCQLVRAGRCRCSQSRQVQECESAVVCPCVEVLNECGEVNMSMQEGIGSFRKV